MEEIIKLGRTDMTSLEIAEITGKRHSDVLRWIRSSEEAWVKINGKSFRKTSYLDAKGEYRPAYILNTVEALYIASKANDEARAMLVLRWRKLEEECRKVPETFSEALILNAKQQAEIEKNSKVLNSIEDTSQISIRGSFKTKRILKYKTYLIKDTLNGVFKIGKSINPLRRLTILRLSNKHLELYAVSELNVETKLHHKFSEMLIEREWYSLSDSDLKDIISEFDFKLNKAYAS